VGGGGRVENTAYGGD